MVSDIAVGIAVLAAARTIKSSARSRHGNARQRRLRELGLRRDHIAERRGKTLDEVL